MYFVNKIKEEYCNKKVIMFVDMDGVIVDYEFGFPLDFKNKRPLKTNIETLKKLSLLENIELHILSVCREDYQLEEKQEWLNKYAPFFKHSNRAIISKESNPNFSSKELKCNYLKNYISEMNNEVVILIDDDNGVLEYIHEEISNIVLYQDSSLAD